MSGGERLYLLRPLTSLAPDTATYDLITSAEGIVVAVCQTRYDILDWSDARLRWRIFQR